MSGLEAKRFQIMVVFVVVFVVVVVVVVVWDDIKRECMSTTPQSAPELAAN